CRPRARRVGITSALVLRAPRSGARASRAWSEGGGLPIRLATLLRHMRDTLQALKSLQEFDSQIFRLRDELRRLPQELERRKAQIDAQKARRDDAQRIAREFDLQVKEIEDMST